MLLNRVDMKPYLMELLCLANYSYRDPDYNLQIKLKKVVLSSEQKYFDALMRRAGRVARNQPFFHDLRPLSLDTDFTMKQFPNIRGTVKSCIVQNKMLRLGRLRLHQIKKAHSITAFQLTVFYYFERQSVEESDIFQSRQPGQSNLAFNETVFKVVDKKNVHSLLVVRNSKPVVVMYNPFIHRIQR